MLSRGLDSILLCGRIDLATLTAWLYWLVVSWLADNTRYGAYLLTDYG